MASTATHDAELPHESVATAVPEPSVCVETVCSGGTGEPAGGGAVSDAVEPVDDPAPVDGPV